MFIIIQNNADYVFNFKTFSYAKKQKYRMNMHRRSETVQAIPASMCRQEQKDTHRAVCILLRNPECMDMKWWTLVVDIRCCSG